MTEDELWESFQKTGLVSDYLRYRGVDIYAAQNKLDKGGAPDGTERKGQGGGTVHHRRPDHPHL